MRKAISYLLTLCIVLSLGVTSFAESEPAALKPGDIVEFGFYEQDNDKANGPEPIEWIVLDVQEEQALLLSKYGLDCKPYNEEVASITWDECTLRDWLNNTFLSSSFTEVQKETIMVSEIDNCEQYFPKKSQDQLFLLSAAEIEDYSRIVMNDLKIEPTSYALKQGARVSGTNFCWWLREIKNNGYNFDTDEYYVLAQVCQGRDPDNEVSVDGKDVLVRPAMWVDLNKLSDALNDMKSETTKDNLSDNSSSFEEHNSQYIITTVTDPNEIDFLHDMASGINKRLLTAPASGTVEGFSKLVAYELDAISKYEAVTFPDADFNEFAHDYIDACQLQQKALDSSDNKAVFEPLWESGRILRAELIAKGYEKYGLDIREEDYLSYKNATNPDYNSASGTGNGPTFEFLEGYWSSRNGMHTFEMKKDHSYITTVPVVPHCGDTYILDNGVIRSYYASNPSQKTDNLKITVVSDTEIEIYSYQTKTSYTLIKRR